LRTGSFHFLFSSKGNEFDFATVSIFLFLCSYQYFFELLNLDTVWYVLRKTKKFSEKNLSNSLSLKLSDTVAWLSLPAGIYHLKVNVATGTPIAVLMFVNKKQIRQETNQH
jgi:hypothetical protein